MFRKCVLVGLVALTLLTPGLHAQGEKAAASRRRETGVDTMGEKEMKQGKVRLKMEGWW